MRGLCILALLILLGGCTGNTEPQLEVREGDTWQTRPVSAYEIAGERDGASTRAVAILTKESGERLRLELVVVYDPTPALGSGRWSIDGDDAGAGDVRAQSLKFLGGQGEGPSLGGRFLLEENGSPRFRVTLPLRPVSQRGWTVE